MLLRTHVAALLKSTAAKPLSRGTESSTTRETADDDAVEAHSKSAEMTIAKRMPAVPTCCADTSREEAASPSDAVGAVAWQLGRAVAVAVVIAVLVAAAVVVVVGVVVVVVSSVVVGGTHSA